MVSQKERFDYLLELLWDCTHYPLVISHRSIPGPCQETSAYFESILFQAIYSGEITRISNFTGKKQVNLGYDE